MTTVRRITPGGLDPSIFSKRLTQRIDSLETRSLGAITLREPIKAVDPVTGVETVFGPLPDGSFGFKENMKDYIPPEVPSQPVISTVLGVVNVYWDGKDKNNAEQVSDFARVKVSMSETEFGSYRPVGYLLNSGTLPVADIPYGEPRYFILNAIDSAGNESGSTAPVMAVTTPLAQSEEVNQFIKDTEAKLRDNAEAALKAQEDAARAIALADNAVGGSGASSLLAGGSLNRGVSDLKDVSNLTTSKVGSKEGGAHVLIPAGVVSSGSFEPTPVKSGNTYRLSMWVRSSSTSATKDAGISAVFTTENNNLISEDKYLYTAATRGPIQSTWELKTYEVTAPSGATTMTIKVGGNNPTADVSLDNVTVFDITDAKQAIEAANIAQAKAEDAARLANLAQTSANNKNTTWFLTSPPVGTGHRLGDIWFDTDDGNALYRWDGSGWVSAQDARVVSLDQTSKELTEQYNTLNQRLPEIIRQEIADNPPDAVDLTPLQEQIEEAAKKAGLALDSANGAAVNYYTPDPPALAKRGDMWFTQGRIRIYSGTDWVDYKDPDISLINSKVADFETFNTELPELIKTTVDLPGLTAQLEEAARKAGLAQASADGKSTVFYTDSAPALAKKGDMWFTAGRIRSYSGTAWVEYKDPAISELTTKVDTFESVVVTNAGNRVHYSATQPTGGGLKGDTWFNTSKDMQVAYYDGTKWVVGLIGANAIADASITDAKIANLNAGKITSGTIAAGRIGAQSIRADKLFVGIGDNLMPPLSMTADYVGAHPNRVLTATGGYTGGVSITVPAGTTQMGAYASGTTSGDYRIKVNPGGSYHVSVWVKPGTKVGQPTIYVRFVNSATGSWSWATPSNVTGTNLTAGAWGNVSGTVTAQPGTTYDRMMIGFFANGDHDAVVFSDPAVREMKDGSLIVNGTITGDKIKAGAITADSGIIASLDAGKITVGELDGARIKANSISTGALGSGSVTTAQLASGAVRGVNIANGSIVANHLTSGSVTTEKIKAGAITADSGIIASLDAGKITVGELSGNRLQAGTISADKLQVGTAENLVVDPLFLSDSLNSARVTGSGSTPSPVISGSKATFTLPSGIVATRKLTLGGDTGDARTLTMRVIPGREYKVSFTVDYTTVAKSSVYAELSVNDGGSVKGIEVSGTRKGLTGSGTQMIEGTVVVPATISPDTAVLSLCISTLTGSSGSISFSRPGFQAMTDGTLITRDSIKTEHIMSNAITADKIKVGSVEAQHIKAGTITSDRLNTIEVGASLVSAGTLQTDTAPNRGVKISNTGIVGYNTEGRETMSINGVTNKIVGEFSTGFYGDPRVNIYNKFNPLWGTAESIIDMQASGMAGVSSYDNAVTRLSSSPREGFTITTGGKRRLILDNQGAVLEADYIVLSGRTSTKELVVNGQTTTNDLAVSGRLLRTRHLHAMESGPHTIGGNAFHDANFTFASTGYRPFIIPSVAFDDAADISVSLWDVTNTTARVRVYNSGSNTVRGLYVTIIVLPLER